MFLQGEYVLIVISLIECKTSIQSKEFDVLCFTFMLSTISLKQINSEILFCFLTSLQCFFENFIL